MIREIGAGKEYTGDLFINMCEYVSVSRLALVFPPKLLCSKV